MYKLNFGCCFQFCEKQLTNHWSRNWEPNQKVPYAYSGNQWIGYEDVESISLKSHFVNDLELGGAMVWSLETDDFRGLCGRGKYPLISSIRQALYGSDEATATENSTPETEGESITEVWTETTAPPQTSTSSIITTVKLGTNDIESNSIEDITSTMVMETESTKIEIPVTRPILSWTDSDESTLSSTVSETTTAITINTESATNIQFSTSETETTETDDISTSIETTSAANTPTNNAESTTEFIISSTVKAATETEQSTTIPSSISTNAVEGTTMTSLGPCISNIYRDPVDCRAFYKCDHGISYRFKCPQPLLFDNATDICNWPRDVQC